MSPSVEVTFKGDLSATVSGLKKAETADYAAILASCGQQGVNALSRATPVDTGRTANSWSYDVRTSGKGIEIVWTNSNVVDGVPVAILLQYGHGTGTGGYVQGRDYIKPAIRPVFDEIRAKIERLVS